MQGGVGIVSRRRPVRSTDRTNVNRDITAKKVRVIGADGVQVGIITISQARDLANESGLDLVEISPHSNPPVCKIMDYGRFKYEVTKKKQAAKKKQSTFQIKEIKVRPKTSDHDIEIKISRIKKFIEKKDKVKVTLVFRGREILLSKNGKAILQKMADQTEEYAIVEMAPKFEGRSMIMILSPKNI